MDVRERKQLFLVPAILVGIIVVFMAVSQQTTRQEGIQIAPDRVDVQFNSQIACGLDGLNQVNVTAMDQDRSTVRLGGIVDLPSGITDNPQFEVTMIQTHEVLLFLVTTKRATGTGSIGNLTSCTPVDSDGTPRPATDFNASQYNWVGTYNATISLPKNSHISHLHILHDGRSVHMENLSRHH